ncbi:MAG TPA: FAD-dependent monooxygenase [Steroidobacteraceae bacterium]|nr:FAD-dependent monooxygenase [Steroidobacteraceae bacterium]
MDCDVAIVGAGLAGACTAALLARTAGIAAGRIVLLAADLAEAHSEPAAASSPPQLRVVAVSRASERILDAAGAWQRLPPARVCAYERMWVWEHGIDAAGALRFDAADVGEPNLGYIIENSWLQWACLTSFRDSGGRLLAGALQELTVDENAVRLTLADGTSVTARLVIGADGAQSAVRTLLSIPAQRRSFGQLGVVANVAGSRGHQHTAWQRFLPGGPLALLPLFDGSCSMVWSLDESRAHTLLHSGVAQFNAQLEAATEGALGAMTLVGARHGFPLQRLAARDFIAPRAALVGDAAHVIHPLAGQGANLGLLDADALCAAVAGALTVREDPGALRALRPYEQQRRTHNRLMDVATRAFHHGFALTGPARWLRQRALEQVDHSLLLKRLFAREALGLGLFRPRQRATGPGAAAPGAAGAAGSDVAGTDAAGQDQRVGI